ncbi:MAG TPA: HAMP domain-containing sensor histidine kinase [Chitinophagales bacterium]|nr:HAMP domain-containing sensor histidine kinase [Chitinophagales bacterium]
MMSIKTTSSIGIRRIRALIALFCCAMLLLLMFTARWLQTEYNSEEMDLHKELVQEFMSARDQVMDTVLTRSFIEPLLSNEGGFKIRHVSQDTITSGDSVTIIAKSFDTDTMIRITSFCDTCPTLSEANLTNIDSNNALMRGVKLFITEVKGDKGGKEFFDRHIELKDTALLQSIYQQNLANQGLNLEIKWVHDSSKFTFPPPMFEYDSHLFNEPFKAQVDGYKSVILTTMVPQFLFAGLLITVVLVAFIFSYRNLRKQWQLAQLKDDLISNISHELKTPVATMKVAIEAMQEMDPVEKKEKIRSYLNMASEEVTRLDTLVNKVMQSVIGDGAHEFFHTTLIDVTGIANGLTNYLQSKHVDINVSIPETPCYVMGDAFHLRSALQNLLDNAAKYGGTKVSLDVSQGADMVQISISDNGPGIPETYHQKIFEKFFRIPTGNVHEVKGYGLGLHYVKQVTEAAGGSISVNNNSDTGCTFTLLIPRADGNH